MRRLRTRIGFVSPAFAAMLRDQVTAVEIVMSAREAALETWWHTYGPPTAHTPSSCSSGSAPPSWPAGRSRRCRRASASACCSPRSLWGKPGLVLLDEPTAGLDLGAREDLVARLSRLATDVATPPTVLVTHHVEEIPRGFTHVLLLRAGSIAAAGPLDDVLTAPALSEVFGLPLAIDRNGGRFAARARVT